MTRRSGAGWRDRDRLLSAVSALLVNGVIGYALLIGLASRPAYQDEVDDSRLALFDLDPPIAEPIEREPEDIRRTEREEGGSPRSSAPPASPIPDPPRASPIVAPVPVIPVPFQSAPVTPVPVAGVTVAGHGSGMGGKGTGEGDGAGSGSGRGDGRGDGDGGSFSSARQTGGRFRNSDFPTSARGAGRLKIGVRYAIGPSGRVDTCEIIESSGYPEVDAMTCRIIKERYRFRPARDTDGYAVTEVREEDYRWRVR